MSEFPMQPLEWDDNVVRFKRNRLVEYLLDHGGVDMNQLALLQHEVSEEHYEQFAQLIGYSVSGFSDLSYASDKIIKEAQGQANEMMAEWEGV